MVRENDAQISKESKCKKIYNLTGSGNYYLILKAMCRQLRDQKKNYYLSTCASFYQYTLPVYCY